MPRKKETELSTNSNGTKAWFSSLKLKPSAKIAIVMHDSPDPDAIGAALCIQWIMKRQFQAESVLFHGGSVSHPQNRTLVNLLNIDLKRVATLIEEQAEYDLKLVVDATPSTWCRTNSLDIEFDAYFDHHPKADVPKGWKGHADYRTIGSSCTIMWAVMRELGLGFEEGNEDDAAVATAMVVGIRIDTEEASSDDTTEIDLEAITALHPFVIQKTLRDIIRYPIPKYYYDLRQRAQEASQVNDNVLVAGVGFLSQESRDALAWVADDLSRRDSVDTCVVFGVISDQIIGVVRCSNPSLQLNAFIEQVFGPSTGGGKRGKAAASAPLGAFFGAYSDSTKDAVWQAVTGMIAERVFHAASGQ